MIQVTRTQINYAARRIQTSAVEFLAAKHGTPASAIYAALAVGHPRIMEQFMELVSAGAAAVVKQAEKGR
jgi:hypothetical protein